LITCIFNEKWMLFLCATDHVDGKDGGKIVSIR